MRLDLFLLLFFVQGVFLLEEEEEGLDEFDHEFYEELENRKSTVKEGDIITDDGNSQLRSSALKNPESRWIGGVPVKFSPTYSKSEESLIRQAIKEIQDKTCLRFRLKKSDDADFVVFARPPDSKSCRSKVGRKGGEQAIYLGAGCLDRRTILHEIMHTLGFIHEHNRADRDDFIEINWENMHTQLKGEFVKRKNDVLDEKMMATGYAYESIMHYQPFQAAKNKNIAVIKAKKEGFRLGGSNQLSDIDVERINLLYGCPGRTAGTKTTNPPIKPQPATPRPTPRPTPPPTKPPTTPAPTVNWIKRNGITWSNYCFFKTYDSYVMTTREQCGQQCKDYGDCDHFTWVGNGGGSGKCHMMNGYTKDVKYNMASSNYACGVVTNKKPPPPPPPPPATPRPGPNPGDYGLNDSYTCQKHGYTTTCKSTTYANGMKTESQCQFTENGGAWSKSCSSSSTSSWG